MDDEPNTQVTCPKCGGEDFLAQWTVEATYYARVDVTRDSDGRLDHEPTEHHELDVETEPVTIEELARPESYLCDGCEELFWNLDDLQRDIDKAQA